LSADGPSVLVVTNEGTVQMIVIGVDPHKQTHTRAAVDRATGQLCGELTVKGSEEGHGRLLEWARGLGAERLFAVEDCRHVSCRLERFLVGRGERVVRVPPKLMAGARRSARQRGKSDAIDALAVARAALREPDLPTARLEGSSREIRLLLDHRDDLVAERTRIQNRLRWHLHEIDPELEPPERSLDRFALLEGLARRLARREQTVQVRLCRELVARCRALTRDAKRLEGEIAALVRREAPQLLSLPGCGALTAAKLIGEVAGIERFRTDSQLAMHAGVAPLDASSGRQQHHRLNRSGNRQLNCALHRIAVTQKRIYAPAKEYLARRQAEGKTNREALRALKRHLARRVFHILTLIANRINNHQRIKISTAPPVPCLT
jgi:transposase